jgi:hypothetical protein
MTIVTLVSGCGNQRKRKFVKRFRNVISAVDLSAFSALWRCLPGWQELRHPDRPPWWQWCERSLSSRRFGSRILAGLAIEVR